ncbi:MAG: hypothetical protein KKH95_12665 [Gammaproteobacteria bacterium]|nr:hypothetical protein [Gammaproteobacteria bacterium]
MPHLLFLLFSVCLFSYLLDFLLSVALIGVLSGRLALSQIIAHIGQCTAQTVELIFVYSDGGCTFPAVEHFMLKQLGSTFGIDGIAGRAGNRILS